MDIESKTSIYEEKEETQEVNPEEQKSEIKSEKEKDRVLQTAVIVAVAILVIGGITVVRRLSNPQKDTKKGTEILKTMDEMDVSKACLLYTSTQWCRKDNGAEYSWGNGHRYVGTGAG